MKSKKSIVVSGANGQLGKSFQKIAFDWPSYEFHFYDRDELDITKRSSVDAVFSSIKPDIFINCAAYTAVDQAETEREKAYAINAESLDFITRACKVNDTLLVHFSTDYVYDNGMNVPMNEDAPTNPKSIYAQSKKMGEEIIAQSPVNALVMRTSWVYSEFGHNFVKTMLKLGKERSLLNIVNDQIGAPTFATDIATAIMKIVSDESAAPIEGCQIINYASEGQISWYDFAAYIFEVAGIDIEIQPIPSADYPTPASRPKWSVLDMGKIKGVYGIAPKYWKESVRECVYLLG